MSRPLRQINHVWSIMKTLFRIAIVAAVSTAAISAHAVVAAANETTFTNRSTWASAAGTPITTVDFSSINGQSRNSGDAFASMSGITFTSENGTSGYGCPTNCGNYGISGTFLSLQHNSMTETLFVSFSKAQSAVGFDADLLGPARQVTVTLSNGDTFNYVANSSDGSTRGVLNFGGLTDTNTFTSLTISSSGDVGLDIANFQAVSAPAAAVPELTTWAMMLIGMGTIGFAMRRRATVAASYV